MKNLSRTELEFYGKLAVEAAKREAFAAGTYVSYERDGKLVREYPDGRVIEVHYDEHGRRRYF